MINKIIRPFIKYIPENNKLERIWILAKTDFKKRYYGTYLGIIWAFINPLFMLIIYYSVFTVFFDNKIENFALYLFSGLLIWMFFSEATKKGMYTIVSKRYLFENFQINSLDIYKASLLSVFIAFIFNFLVYFIISLFFNIPYNINIFLFPLIVLNLLILIFGINLILSTLYTYLRDFDHFYDLFLIAAFWINPIFYPESLLTQSYRFILFMNPIAGIMINTRNVMLYGTGIDIKIFVINWLYSIVILLIGLIINHRYSKKLIEIL